MTCKGIACHSVQKYLEVLIDKNKPKCTLNNKLQLKTSFKIIAHMVYTKRGEMYLLHFIRSKCLNDIVLYDMLSAGCKV